MLVYRFEVASSWRDSRTRKYIYERKVMVFLSYRVHERACCYLFATEEYYLFNSIVLLRAYNVFGQHHPAPVTLATKATPHAAYTGRVPSRMPRACPRPTKKWKH